MYGLALNVMVEEPAFCKVRSYRKNEQGKNQDKTVKYLKKKTISTADELLPTKWKSTQVQTLQIILKMFQRIERTQGRLPIRKKSLLCRLLHCLTVIDKDPSMIHSKSVFNNSLLHPCIGVTAKFLKENKVFEGNATKAFEIEIQKFFLNETFNVLQQLNDENEEIKRSSEGSNNQQSGTQFLRK
ncbi:hypothetical protein BD770DRAFT_408211 [Pilaira anomala]|nr:hypothetical protein BD770DRAFT_408211 [Pilaira anomala]